MRNIASFKSLQNSGRIVAFFYLKVKRLQVFSDYNLPMQKLPVLIFFLFVHLFGYEEYTLRLLDSKTLAPIEGAKSVIGTSYYKSDANGSFHIDIPVTELEVKAPGYTTRTITLDANRTILMEPFDIKALYLSFWAAGTKKFTSRIFKLIDETEINAVVIDVKNEYGFISYPGSVPEARAAGAYETVRIREMGAFLKRLKEKGIYTIARIVVFKDDRLATHRPDLALHDQSGAVWRNGEDIGWSDPFLEEVHDYNIAIAVEAAKEGFDEINLDYIRFPGAGRLRYAKRNTKKNRVAAIDAFLGKMQRALDRTGVMISLDTYGYVCWNENDTGIGHQLADMGRYADYLSPMLYPSSYHLGIPGYEESLKHIYRLIHDTLQEGYRRTLIPRRRFRPWLQTFPDYAFDKRKFGGWEIREQINAAEDFNASGWMLWHPGSYFYPHGLKKAD